MLGWRPLLFAWFNKLPVGVTEELKKLLTSMFDRMCRPVSQWLRKGLVRVSSYVNGYFEVVVNTKLTEWSRFTLTTCNVHTW